MRTKCRKRWCSSGCVKFWIHTSVINCVNSKKSWKFIDILCNATCVCVVTTNIGQVNKTHCINYGVFRVWTCKHKHGSRTFLWVSCSRFYVNKTKPQTQCKNWARNIAHEPFRFVRMKTKHGWQRKKDLCCLWSINRKLLQFVTNGVELSEQHRSKEVVVVVIIIELNDIEPTFSMESVKMNAASMYLNDQKCLYTKYRVLLNCLVLFFFFPQSVE